MLCWRFKMDRIHGLSTLCCVPTCLKASGILSKRLRAEREKIGGRRRKQKNTHWQGGPSCLDGHLCRLNGTADVLFCTVAVFLRNGCDEISPPGRFAGPGLWRTVRAGRPRGAQGDQYYCPGIQSG